MNVTAVIFDLDGVLIDTESVAQKSWYQAAKDFGFEFSAELYADMVGRPVELCRELIKPNLPEGINIDEYMHRSEHLYTDTMERDGVQLIQGVPDLLKWIEQSGLAVAIATSSQRDNAHKKIQMAGLQGKIEIIVTCDDVKHSKPAPDIFLLAAQRLGHPIDQCVVIEDSEAGVLAAHAAGAIPMMLPGTVDPSANARRVAFTILHSLYEVPAIMRGIEHQSQQEYRDESK